MTPQDILEKFLLSHYINDANPLLLALSGGPDSLCLFYCLLAYRKKHGCAFHIAHVDHAWRPESRAEADELARLAKEYEVPFHLKRLDPADFHGNLEDYCRQARYQYFNELCLEFSFQAVLVGHHKDDLAETVLKRVLEGAHWSNLSGPQEESYFGQMRIWRPFLPLTKSDLKRWLKDKGKEPFEDPTNENPKFLRCRLRNSILPLLSEEFGKQVQAPLVQLGMEASELTFYFDEKIGPYLQRSIKGPFGVYINLMNDLPSSHLEVKYLIRKLCEKEGYTLSRDAIEQAASFLEIGAANKLLENGQTKLWVDRKRLFFTQKKAAPFEKEISLSPGGWNVGEWEIKIEEVRGGVSHHCDWETGWKGVFSGWVPFGSYKLALPEANASFRDRNLSISKWWNSHKIPAFLRSFVPVIWADNTIFYEFLTGKINNSCPLKDGGLHIQMKYGCDKSLAKGTPSS